VALLAMMIWLAIRLGPLLMDRTRRRLFKSWLSRSVAIANRVFHQIVIIAVLWLQCFFG